MFRYIYWISAGPEDLLRHDNEAAAARIYRSFKVLAALPSSLGSAMRRVFRRLAGLMMRRGLRVRYLRQNPACADGADLRCLSADDQKQEWTR